jgi:hypothetical protein
MKLPALKEIIEERKEKAIESLSDSFAKNRLPLEEYERLVEYINKIESERELALVEKMVAEHEGGYDENKTPVYDDDDESDEDEPDYRHSLGNIAILSSRNFSGPVKSGSEIVCILGSGNIKVRMADLNKRQTVLTMVSVLGDITIYVESGIRVVNKAMPILGNSSVNQKVKKQAQQDGPEIVIEGVAVLGSIAVKLIKEGK